MPTATAKPPKTDPAEVEAERLERRLSRKKYVGNQRLQILKAVALDDRIRLLSVRIEEAAGDHQAACQPTQQRLEKLESELSDLLAARKPLPLELQAKRTELLTSILDQNGVLETRIAAIKNEQWKLEQESTALKQSAKDVTSVENELASFPLANEKLLLEQHALSQAAKFLELRLKSASESLERVEGHIKNSDTYLASIGEATTWNFKRARYEFDVASRELAAARERGNQLYKLMLDE